MSDAISSRINLPWSTNAASSMIAAAGNWARAKVTQSIKIASRWLVMKLERRMGHFAGPSLRRRETILSTTFDSQNS